MKTLSLILSLVLIYLFMTPSDQVTKVNQRSPLTKTKDQVFYSTLSREIKGHKNFARALKSIETIDQIEAEAKTGHFNRLEKKLVETFKAIKNDSSLKRKMEFQECLVIWIKYFQKETIKDHPHELFALIPYNPKLYKQYLLAIHEGFYPNFTYTDSSELLRDAIKGEFQ